MNELIAALGKLAERSSANVSPLAGVLVFGSFYMNLPMDRPESQFLSWAMAIPMAASAIVFSTRMLFNWPKLPLVDNEKSG